VTTLHTGVASDQRVLNARANIAYTAVFQNNAAFDFGVLHDDIFIDAGEGADIAVLDERVFADNRRAAHSAVDNACAAFNRDAPVNLRVLDDSVGCNSGFQFFQHKAVGFQH